MVPVNVPIIQFYEFPIGMFWDIRRNETLSAGHWQLKWDIAATSADLAIWYCHYFERYGDMGVSLNGGTPKWIVYNGQFYENWWFKGKTSIWCPICWHVHLNIYGYESKPCIFLGEHEKNAGIYRCSSPGPGIAIYPASPTCSTSTVWTSFWVATDMALS